MTRAVAPPSQRLIIASHPPDAADGEREEAEARQPEGEIKKVGHASAPCSGSGLDNGGDARKPAMWKLHCTRKENARNAGVGSLARGPLCTVRRACRSDPTDPLPQRIAGLGHRQIMITACFG